MMNTVACLACVLMAAASWAQPTPDFEVHEWGTFTTVTRGDGKMLDWRPLDAPRDLPAFVHEAVEGPKLRFVGTVRMETPVIYFHARQAVTVDVGVGFPLGHVTEWYPQVSSRSPLGNRVTWKGVQVLPGADLTFPGAGETGHYFAARAVSSAPIRSIQGDLEESERFIFYRGVGSPKLPVEVRFEEDTIRVKGLIEAPIRYIVFESDGNRSDYGIYGAWREKNDMPVPRPLVDRIEFEGLDHDGALEKLLTEQGLFPEEAKAMVATWKDDWFEPGLRVFWVVPSDVIDSLLPLEVSPKPSKTVRAFVGRVEILTPDFVARVEQAARGLLDERREALDALGRFASPILIDLSRKTQDKEIRDAIVGYLKTLDERPAPPTPLPAPAPAPTNDAAR
jgi:hypothetical protein